MDCDFNTTVSFSLIAVSKGVIANVSTGNIEIVSAGWAIDELLLQEKKHAARINNSRFFILKK